MKLIVGLGNPSEKYKNTRHNVGFMVLDKIQRMDLDGYKMPPFRLENQYKARITQTGGIGEARVTFVKPQTYMNNSGETVEKIKNYLKIEDEDIIVICDDLNLSLGAIRVRFEGSDGGHKGLKSVIQLIGKKFWRVRIGIGRNKIKNQKSKIKNSSLQSDQGKQVQDKNVKCQNIPAEDYVLKKFPKDEQQIIIKSIDKAAEYILKSISNGLKEETIKININ